MRCAFFSIPFFLFFNLIACDFSLWWCIQCTSHAPHKPKQCVYLIKWSEREREETHTHTCNWKKRGENKELFFLLFFVFVHWCWGCCSVYSRTLCVYTVQCTPNTLSLCLLGSGSLPRRFYFYYYHFVHFIQFIISSLWILFFPCSYEIWMQHTTYILRMPLWRTSEPQQPANELSHRLQCNAIE